MTLAEVEERLRKILRRTRGSHSHSTSDGTFELVDGAERRLRELLQDIERERLLDAGGPR